MYNQQVLTVFCVVLIMIMSKRFTVLYFLLFFINQDSSVNGSDVEHSKVSIHCPHTIQGVVGGTSPDLRLSVRSFFGGFRFLKN